MNLFAPQRAWESARPTRGQISPSRAGRGRQLAVSSRLQQSDWRGSRASCVAAAAAAAAAKDVSALVGALAHANRAHLHGAGWGRAVSGQARPQSACEQRLRLHWRPRRAQLTRSGRHLAAGNRICSLWLRAAAAGKSLAASGGLPRRNNRITQKVHLKCPD